MNERADGTNGRDVETGIGDFFFFTYLVPLPNQRVTELDTDQDNAKQKTTGRNRDYRHRH